MLGDCPDLPSLPGERLRVPSLLPGDEDKPTSSNRDDEENLIMDVQAQGSGQKRHRRLHGRTGNGHRDRPRRMWCGE